MFLIYELVIILKCVCIYFKIKNKKRIEIKFYYDKCENIYLICF